MADIAGQNNLFPPNLWDHVLKLSDSEESNSFKPDNFISLSSSVLGKVHIS